jgi:hypothetical protein
LEQFWTSEEKSRPVSQREVADGRRGVRRADLVVKNTPAGITAAQDLDRECVRPAIKNACVKNLLPSLLLSRLGYW